MMEFKHTLKIPMADKPHEVVVSFMRTSDWGEWQVDPEQTSDPFVLHFRRGQPQREQGSLLGRLRRATHTPTGIEPSTPDNEVPMSLAAVEIDESDVAAALADFDGVWDALAPREQARVLALLIARVDHDGSAGNVSITFHPTGIKTLAAELYEEDAA